ncbi:MAG: gamma-glutamyl-gamma-aminobutyrate hydrolase family protein, partial [Bacteroidia bacterium]|nr:gamma-glutamyl-gamma-aminobutyrate hydrolase family protein [Bacteroidia bacterium]
MHEKIIILDFGSQYTQLIARRVRELNVYCEIHPFNKIPDLDDNIKGVILSGGPSSVNVEDAPQINLESILDKFPVLGICYGAQLLVKEMGGVVSPSAKREYGRANLSTIENSTLLKGVSNNSQVWMSHGDTVEKLPDNFELIAGTDSIEVAAYK